MTRVQKWSKYLGLDKINMVRWI